MNIVILERHSVGMDVPVDCLNELGNVTVYEYTAYEEIADRVADADIIIANKSKLNESTLSGATHLKLICEFATGFDNVDLSYCKSRGIGVCNVRDYSTDMVAQHTFSLALYLSQKLRHYDDFVKDGSYGAQPAFSNFEIPFTELAGKTWGIIGMGNIGKKVAAIAKAFGCRVIFFSVTGKSSVTEYERVEFDELLTQSDYVSLHCPLSDLTRNLIDGKALKKMKNTAYLINVARGPVVNQEDLYDALMNDEIAGAGLDVLSAEPIVADNPLGRIKDSNKLFITPHLAWASVEARNRCVVGAYENIKSFLQGDTKNRVDLGK